MKLKLDRKEVEKHIINDILLTPIVFKNISNFNGLLDYFIYNLDI